MFKKDNKFVLPSSFTNGVSKVLPDAIIEMIISYCRDRTIIYFQKKFPRLLQTMTITNTNAICQQLQQHIRKMTIYNYNYNKAIKYFANLIYLSCHNNKLITDDIFVELPNLLTLHCGNCDNVTGRTLFYLINLMELYCGRCKNIDDCAFVGLSRLERLYCNECKIRGLTFKHLHNLNDLICYKCPNLSDDAFYGLNKLTHLDCRYNKLTGVSVCDLTNLVELKCDSCPITVIVLMITHSLH